MRSAASAHQQVLATFAGIGHALGHPARLRILLLLTQAPKTVTMLAEAIHESIANTSAHLGVLSDRGLVRRSRVGRHVRYSLADASVAALVTSLRTVAEGVAPRRARRHLDLFDGPDVAALTPRTLPGHLASGVELVDVRPEDEFAAGHLPGARSLPLSRLRERRRAGEGTGRLLLYCRGRYCLGAIEGVQLLSRAGRDVKRLPFGVAEWTAAGHVLVTNEEP